MPKATFKKVQSAWKEGLINGGKAALGGILSYLIPVIGGAIGLGLVAVIGAPAYVYALVGLLWIDSLLQLFGVQGGAVQ